MSRNLRKTNNNSTHPENFVKTPMLQCTLFVYIWREKKLYPTIFFVKFNLAQKIHLLLHNMSYPNSRHVNSRESGIGVRILMFGVRNKVFGVRNQVFGILYLC